MNEELIKNTNLDRIVDEGKKIYEQLRSQYEPLHDGKFLVIEPDSKKVYFGETAFIARDLAVKDHPDKMFYLVEIGYDRPENIARMFNQRYP